MADLEYIDLADFRPGIRSNFFTQTDAQIEEDGTVTPGVQDGAAQEDGTIGCVALPSGGLGPLPRARAYLQDTTFWDNVPHGSPFRQFVTPAYYEEWEPSWKNAARESPIRVPITAAKLMPAAIGPARSGEEDIPSTEPESHDPIVYWHFSPSTTHGLDFDFDIDPFGPCGEEIDAVTPYDTSLFPTGGHFWGIGVWARACSPSPLGGVTVQVETDGDGGNGAQLLMTLVVTAASVFGRTYTRNNGEMTAITAGATAGGDIEEWRYYWCAMQDQNPGGTLEGTMTAGVDDAVGDVGSINILMEAFCSGASGWQYDYSLNSCDVNDSQNTRISLHKDEEWEIFGLGIYPQGIDQDGFHAIFESQGPVLAEVSPGFVTPGHRPDLTSGDIVFPGAVAVTYDVYSDAGGGENYTEKMIGRLYKPFLIDPQDGPNVVNPNFYDMYNESIAVQESLKLRGYSNYDFTRSRHADTTVIGPPFLIGLFSPYNEDADGAKRVLRSFPAPATLSADSTLDLVTGEFLFAQFTHQSRVLFLGHSTEEGADLPMGSDIVLGGFERWGWLGANDIEVIDNAMSTIYVEENPFGYGAMASLNANECLLIKQMGGGVSVRGAVAGSTTVVRLPGLASTQSFYNIGVHTPYGYFYGSTRGCWLWSGGDQSVLVSPDLPGRFLIASDESIDDYLGMKGSFTFIEPFLFAPNSWVFDTRTESWWRLQEHPDLTDNYPMGLRNIWHSIDTKGLVWAFPSYLAIGPSDEVGWNVFCQLYDLDVPDSRFQWTSQPLAKTQAREVTFREIILHTSGKGTVTITLTGIDGQESTATFPVDSNQRVALRGDVSLASADVVCRIRSEASDPDLPAPYVHRVRLGHQPATKVAK